MLMNSESGTEREAEESMHEAKHLTYTQSLLQSKKH